MRSAVPSRSLLVLLSPVPAFRVTRNYTNEVTFRGVYSAREVLYGPTIGPSFLVNAKSSIT